MIRFALYLALYAMTSAIGLVMLKKGMASGAAFSDVSLRNQALWSFLLGFILYGIGFIMWMALLRTHLLTFVFPLAAGSLFLAVALLGWIWLGEVLSPLRLVGMAVIVLGLALVSMTSPAAGGEAINPQMDGQ